MYSKNSILTLILVLSLIILNEADAKLKGKKKTFMSATFDHQTAAMSQKPLYQNTPDVRCDYYTERGIINCNRQVECNNTFLNMTAIDINKVNTFAISVLLNQENVVLPELIKFYLYPKFNETVYQNHTIQLGNMFHRMSIYYANDYFDDGVRFVDIKCYESLVNLFKQSATSIKKIIQVVSPTEPTQFVTVFGFLQLFKF